MAKSIQSLDFKVILNDTSFDKQIKKDIQLAEKLNKTLSELAEKGVDLGGLDKIGTKSTTASKSMEKLNNTTEKQSRLMRGLTGLAATYFSVAGAERLLTSLVRITAEFELQRTTLRAILQDTEGADHIFEQIKELAVTSPFTFKELATYVKQLSAFSVPMNELYDTTKMLADVSAGLGVGMDRLVLAYGQIRSASFLRGQEVRQLTEAGVPILEELRAQFAALGEEGITVGDVFDKISARLVPFEMVNKVFKEMTSEGGKFYNMQAIQAETLKGKLSNLTDAYQIMFSEIGDKMSPTLKGAVDSIKGLADNYEKVGRILGPLVVTFGVYKTTILACHAAEKAYTAGRAVEYFLKLTKRVNTATAAMRAFNGVTSASILGAIVSVVAGLGTVIFNATKKAGELSRALNDIANVKMEGAQKSVSRFTELTSKLKSATQGSEAYREAISSLNREYGEYLPHLLSEKNALAEIEANERKVTTAIYERARAYAYEEGAREIAESGQMAKMTQRVIDYFNQDAFGLDSTSIASFIQVLRKAFTEASAGDNNKSVFYRAVESYFGSDSKVAQIFKSVYPVQMVNQFAKAVREEAEAYEMLNTSLDARFGHGYSTEREKQEIEEINKEYEKQVALLKQKQLTPQLYRRELKSIEVSKLEKMITLYEELGRMDIANQLQADLDAMVKAPEGWVGVVQKLLEAYGVFAQGEGDMGLWADGNTSYLKYVDNLRETYAGLKQQIVDTAKSEPQLNAQLVRQKELIEAVAQALGITLAVSQEGKKEDPFEAYQRYMDNWFVGDLEGEGSTYNISRAVTTYEKQCNDAAKRVTEATAKLNAAFTPDQQVISNTKYYDELAKIVDKGRKMEGNATTTLINTIKKEAQNWVKTWDMFAGYDMTNWHDMSANELRELSRLLGSIDVSDIINQEGAEDIKKMLIDATGDPGIWDIFIKGVKKAIEGLQSKADHAWSEEQVQLWTKIAQIVSKLASSFSELGEAMDSPGIQAAASALDRISNSAQSILSAYQSGGEGAATVASIEEASVLIVDLITNTVKFQKALREARLEAEAANWSEMLSSGTDTIFGSDSMQSLRNAFQAISELTASLADLNESTTLTYRTWGLQWQDLWGGPLTYSIRNIKGETIDLQKASEDLGISLYNTYGGINSQLLEAILNTYPNLNKASKEWLESAAVDAAAYEEAMEQLYDTMEDTLGNLAGDIVDEMYDSFLACGDAAAYVGDSIDEWAVSLAKAMVQSLLMQTVLEKYKEDFVNLYKNVSAGEMTPEELAGQMKNLASAIQDETGAVAKFFNQFLEALQAVGITLSGDTSSDESLATGIQSLTEDTGNLLASYINAIRADVSVIRGGVASIAPDVKVLLGLVPTNNTLEYYLASIQASSLNISAKINYIYDNLITQGADGGSAFRVTN